MYRPAEKADRHAGFLFTLDALVKACLSVAAFAGTAPIDMTVTFYPPDRRHRDDDGMIGAFKHMRDGIADALRVNDRRFRPTYAFGEPEKPGRVEVTL